MLTGILTIAVLLAVPGTLALRRRRLWDFSSIALKELNDALVTLVEETVPALRSKESFLEALPARIREQVFTTQDLTPYIEDQREYVLYVANAVPSPSYVISREHSVL